MVSVAAAANAIWNSSAVDDDDGEIWTTSFPLLT